MKEKCYEFFRCSQIECPMFGENAGNCWELEDTLHHFPSIETLHCMLFQIGKKKCDYCVYYKSAQ